MHLNDAQREVAEHRGSPLLVFAAAGTGKTQALTARIAHVVEHDGVSPDAILALTFTRKAAAEMRGRAEALLEDTDSSSSLDNVCTFHSLCVRILRGRICRGASRRKCRISTNFTILEPSQAEALLDDCIPRALADIDPTNSRSKTTMSPSDSANRVMRTIDEWRNRGLEPDAPELLAEAAAEGADKRLAARAYAMYRESCARQDVCDFSDLILHACSVLLEAGKTHVHGFEHLLVDEFQDTNPAQMRLVRLLLERGGGIPEENLMVVGDDYQAIHEWRGATVRNILEFTKEFPAARVVCLEINYRSVPAVIEAANRVIRNNVKQRHKRLVAARACGEEGQAGVVGGAVVTMRCDDPYDEARRIAEMATTDVADGVGMAVLYRTNGQSLLIEQALAAAGVRYVVRGSLAFFERTEIRDCMSYARLAVNPLADEDFCRAIAAPSRGLGKTTIERIDRFREETIGGEGGLMCAARAMLMLMLMHPTEGGEKMLAKKRAGALRSFVDVFVPGARDERAGVALEALLDRAEYATRRWGAGASDEEERRERLGNVDALVDLAHRFDGSLADFVDSCAIDGNACGNTACENDSNDDEDIPAAPLITLMTLHSSKGLEFPRVVIAGCCEGILPFSMAIAEGRIEEERRLCYVGITRARDCLVLSVPDRIARFRGQPLHRSKESRFITEMRQTCAKTCDHIPA